MNCDDAKILMNDFLDRDLDSERHAHLQQHLDSCKPCYSSMDYELLLQKSLKILPVVEKSTDFETRILAQIEHHKVKKYNAVFPALAVNSLVAGFAVWLAFGSLFNSNTPSESLLTPDVKTVAQQALTIETVQLAVNQTQNVVLSFNSASDFSNVSLTVALPDSVEFSGHPGLREISWDTSLTNGVNVLTLPLVALKEVNGEIIATIKNDGKTKQFSLKLVSAQSTSMDTRRNNLTYL